MTRHWDGDMADERTMTLDYISDAEKTATLGQRRIDVSTSANPTARAAEEAVRKIV